jgi:hypothetical protein
MPKGIYQHKKLSKETKQKIRNALKGRKILWKDKLKGRKCSKKTKEKMSKAKKGIKLTDIHKKKLSEAKFKNPTKMFGSKNPMWKGGPEFYKVPFREKVQSLFEYRQWRSDVFTRDNFTCQDCGLKGVYLHAHHIKLFSIIIKENNITTIEQAINCPELWNINNGITFCKKCHEKRK